MYSLLSIKRNPFEMCFPQSSSYQLPPTKEQSTLLQSGNSSSPVHLKPLPFQLGLAFLQCSNEKNLTQRPVLLQGRKVEQLGEEKSHSKAILFNVFFPKRFFHTNSYFLAEENSPGVCFTSSLDTF